MNIMVFDIETIPDVVTGRRLYDCHDANDAEVAEIMFSHQREKTGTDFLPHFLQRIVAISIVLRNASTLKVWSLGDLASDEKDLVHRFFQGIEHYKPTLISWNGSGFDLPVLHYRALYHGITASTYWESGDNDQQFRWNNYLNRYHARHTDLMDCLAGFQARANAPLDKIATMLGFPGKMGMSGANVWKQYQDGDLATIRNYCETDVLNTYLVYLRFEQMRGNLDDLQYERELARLRDTLTEGNKPHLAEFNEHWQ